jgi:Protein of unknown function (DUF2958)
VIKLRTPAGAATPLLTELDTDGDAAFSLSNLQRSLSSRPAADFACRRFAHVQCCGVSPSSEAH